MHKFFDSVELIWVVWLASLISVTLVTRWLWLRRPVRGLGAVCRVFRDESGAVYSLAVVMVLPFYILMICVIAETTLMLVAKMGTVYAAFCADRAAIVWDMNDVPVSGSSPSPASTSSLDSRIDQKATDAARIAMTPFSSGNPLHSGMTASGGADNGSDDSKAYLDAFRKAAPHSAVNNDYLARKHRYARLAVSVEIRRLKPDDAVGDLEATVTYEYPFQLPVVGRLFGASRAAGGAYLVYPIRSTAALPSEAPRNPDRSLGIEYRLN